MKTIYRAGTESGPSFEEMNNDEGMKVMLMPYMKDETFLFSVLTLQPPRVPFFNLFVHVLLEQYLCVCAVFVTTHT